MENDVLEIVRNLRGVASMISVHGQDVRAMFVLLDGLEKLENKLNAAKEKPQEEI